MVIAAINGKMTLKKSSDNADKLNYTDVKAGDFDESMIWGMATNVIDQI